MLDPVVFAEDSSPAYRIVLVQAGATVVVVVAGHSSLDMEVGHRIAEAEALEGDRCSSRWLPCYPRVCLNVCRKRCMRKSIVRSCKAEYMCVCRIPSIFSIS